MSMRPTEFEIRDHRSDVIPIDVRFDPETEVGQINCYIVSQDGSSITITYEMANNLVVAIRRLEQSRSERHEGDWQKNWKESDE